MCGSGFLYFAVDTSLLRRACAVMRCEKCGAILYIDIVGNRRRIDRYDPNEKKPFDPMSYFGPPPMFSPAHAYIHLTGISATAALPLPPPCPALCCRKPAYGNNQIFMKY